MAEPIEKKHLATMNKLAKVVDFSFNGNTKPSKTGFILLAFDFGDPEVGYPRMNYISNCNRADALCALREFIANHEGRMVEEPKTPQ